MAFGQELLVVGAYMAALVLCTGVVGWALAKLVKRDLTLRHGVSISVGQCICIAGLGSGLTMLFSRWFGETYVIAVLMCLAVMMYGIHLGFEIARRKGGHKPGGTSGEAGLESPAS